MSIFSPQGSGSRYIVAAIIVAALQTAVLGYVIESRASILRSGTDALLKTAPSIRATFCAVTMSC